MLEFNLTEKQRIRLQAYFVQGTLVTDKEPRKIFNAWFRVEALKIKAFVTDGELFLAVTDGVSTSNLSMPESNYSVWHLGYGKPKRVHNFNFGVYYSSIANIYEALDGAYRAEQLRSVPNIKWDVSRVPEFLKMIELSEVIYG